MLQVVNIEDIFKRYFENAIIPDRIIELGTMTARLTHILHRLRSQYNNDFDIITIDQRRDIVPEFEYLPTNMIYCQMNIFPNIEFIGNLIKDKTLILCDNGNKIQEVRALYHYMKPDCVIMAHDYFHSQQDFKEQKNWPSCEITHADLFDLYLYPYLQDIMLEGHWMSAKKII